MKNVLVTGAAGFLGSHLALHHLRAGDRVWGVDDFSSSSMGSDHYRQLMAHDAFTMAQGDISTFENRYHHGGPMSVGIRLNHGHQSDVVRQMMFQLKHIMLNCG